MLNIIKKLIMNALGHNEVATKDDTMVILRFENGKHKLYKTDSSTKMNWGNAKAGNTNTCKINN